MTTLYTIGHSSHSLQEFLAMLEAHEITDLVDVRTIPKSRYVPWFNQTQLKAALNKIKITYFHMPELGGLRRPNKDSINKGWRNSGFRGFADYMQKPEFYIALKQLNQRIKKHGKVAIMCAEAVPWHCHRSLIADAEIIRGVTVLDILSRTSIRPHSLTSFAVVDKSKRPMQIFYPQDK